MDELFAYLSSLASLPTELQAALITRFKKEFFRKRKTLLTAGSVCDWIVFVETGLVKLSYDIPGGDERIVSIHRAGEMAFAVKSFTTGEESRISIAALEDTVVRRIWKSELEVICAKYPALHYHVRRMVEIQTNLLEDHYLLFTLPPRERYATIIRQGPWLLKDPRIRDYMVAAYLGIDRATLSRFKNKK